MISTQQAHLLYRNRYFTYMGMYTGLPSIRYFLFQVAVKDGKPLPERLVFSLELVGIRAGRRQDSRSEQKGTTELEVEMGLLRKGEDHTKKRLRGKVWKPVLGMRSQFF